MRDKDMIKSLTEAEQDNCVVNAQNKVTPLVSIVVPVYNVEETLYSCLMSVVFQTLTDIEVIIVNDCSPDGSQKIIDEFTSSFPEKVKCICHEQNQGLAYARRTGVHNASAPYVVFVDSDDFVSGDFSEILYNQILENDLDMVYYRFTRFYQDSKKEETFIPPTTCTSKVYIKKIPAAFWGAIYKKKFLLDNEDVAFKKMYFEDAASTPVLVSRTNKIGSYRHKNLYYYRYGRIGSICQDRITKSKVNDFFNADNIIWNNVNESYRAECAYRIVDRAVYTVTKMPEIYDYALYHLRDILKKTDEYKKHYPSTGENTRKKAYELPDNVSIPKIVYINGFLKSELIDFELYTAEAINSYLFDPEVVILDESNCNMSQLPEWLENASNEDKGIYFAILKIAETGGIYISPSLRTVTSFNREAFNSAFFVAGPQNRVLPCAFGAEPSAELIKSIIENIHKHYHNNYSLIDTISYSIIEKCGVHLSGNNEYDNHGTHIIPFKYVCGLSNSSQNYCFLDYSNYQNHNNMLVVPYELMQMAWEKCGGTTKKVVDEKHQKKLKAVYDSNAWKVLSRYYKIRDRIRSLFSSK